MQVGLDNFMEMVKNFIVLSFIEVPQPPSDHGITYRIGPVNFTNISVAFTCFGVPRRGDSDEQLGYSAYS